MRIRIDRAWKRKGYTISRVIINGERFGDGKKWCSILEDEDRGLHSDMTLEEIKRIKVKGATAIPRGVYEVRMTYSPKFGRMMPEIMRVPGFTGVRIHAGNDAGDTEGCLLPGVNDIKGRVSNSRYWAGLIEKLIVRAEKNGEMIWIEVG